MPRPPDLLDTTERIGDLLAGQGIQAMVIGAVAMAAHRYVRPRPPRLDVGNHSAGTSSFD
jgi:hypothetical protein